MVLEECHGGLQRIRLASGCCTATAGRRRLPCVHKFVVWPLLTAPQTLPEMLQPPASGAHQLLLEEEAQPAAHRHHWWREHTTLRPRRRGAAPAATRLAPPLAGAGPAPPPPSSGGRSARAPSLASAAGRPVPRAARDAAAPNGSTLATTLSAPAVLVPSGPLPRSGAPGWPPPPQRQVDPLDEGGRHPPAEPERVQRRPEGCPTSRPTLASTEVLVTVDEVLG